ncbi:MAG: ABC transporter permease [Chloracidobacterium sp.]|nr:ABC transporter permease [Chloracidobacterium sp.]
MLNKLRLQLRALFFKPKMEDELQAELQFHLEREIEENIARGMNAEDARYAALRRFGGVERVKEESRDVRGIRLLEEVWQDLRYGARMLMKQTGFTLIAVLTLALGIGANTAVFSLLDAMLLKMLPVKEPEQLVLFHWVSGEKTLWRRLSDIEQEAIAPGLKSGATFSYIGFEQLRARNRSLSDIFAFSSKSFNARIDGKLEEVSSWVVSGGYFNGLGVPALLGRTLTEDDDSVNAEPAMVISYDCWQRRFGGDPTVVGKVVYLGDTPFTIVGVIPPEFYGTVSVGKRLDFTVPLALLPQALPQEGNSLSDPRNWWLFVMGRMKPGVSREQALGELNLAYQQHAADLQKLFKDRRDMPRLELLSGSQGVFQARRGLSRPLRLLMTISSLVLAVACLNIANLLLARAASRRREIAVRLAAGASRLRLIRQLLTESLLLAGLGGALGLVLSHWGKTVLLALRPFDISITMDDVKLDLRMLGFTLAISALTGFIFGLAPALRATKVDLNSALKEGSDQTGYSRSRLSKGLIVSQVAISLVVLIGAGLYIRTVRNLIGVDVGFNRENLLNFDLHFYKIGYKGERLAGLYRQLFERIEAVPGVRSVTGTSNCSVFATTCTAPFCAPGYSPQPGEKMSLAYYNVAPNFFETMDVPILRGRPLVRQDNELPTGALTTEQGLGGKPPRDFVAPAEMAVINQAMARKYFPNVDPIGRSFSLSENCGGERRAEIVGIAGDVRHSGLRAEIRPTAYLPYVEYPRGAPAAMSFIVRTAGDPNLMVAAIQRAVQDVEPRLPLTGVGTQAEGISGFVTQSRNIASLTSFFGLLALILVAIGLYGVMSYTVARRTHEIGVRMALGAQAGHMLWMVMRETLWMALAGVALGIPAALVTTRSIASDLFGLSPHDPLTITLVTLSLMAVMMLAGYLPAKRAAQADPIAALRCE